MIKDRWPKDLFSNKFIDSVVLDEASQMSLPEAMAAALGLKATGQVIVVGDHRQMPPIVKNDWAGEPRRTFKEFKAYASLFEALRERNPPMVKFEESFRLHHDMAEFLGREIYAQDGIAFHSKRHDLIEQFAHADDFVSAVLAPEHPLTVIVHDESLSLKRNEFEQELIRPILEALSDKEGHALTAKEGLGVVVPHTAQRAGLLEAIECLTEYDAVTGDPVAKAVNTVERYQGDERSVILISSTESDREYLLVSGKFLLDPRRLTVALSRAKRKLVLVAARSIFEVFSGDEETFANAQLWKNLLRKTCTVPLWNGERNGHAVEVWGNQSTSGPNLLN
jgi:superfamily I DNA and/or RNA helicase